MLIREERTREVEIKKANVFIFVVISALR